LNESAFRAPVQACAMGDGGSLEERIRFIMSGASSSRPSMPLRLFAMAAASVSMLAGVACVSSGQGGLAAPSSAPRSAPAAPSSASAPQDADRTSRTLQASIEGATSLHVESLSGSIKIVRDDSAKVMQVTAVIDWGDFTQGTNEWTVVNVGNGTTITVGQGTQRSRLSAAQRKELIDSAKLVAEKDSSGRVTVRVELPEADGWRQLPAVNITVRTAALIDVHAESMNGAIDTAGDLGKLHVETVNGEINVSGIASALQAESMNGQVRISLADSAAASVDADCTNGRIVLELPASWSGEVNASTIHGRVDTKGIDGTTDRDLVGASFEGKVGSGNGAVATLDVVNGSIEVRKR
jgi:hypothetical protein